MFLPRYCIIYDHNALERVQLSEGTIELYNYRRATEIGKGRNERDTGKTIPRTAGRGIGNERFLGNNNINRGHIYVYNCVIHLQDGCYIYATCMLL